MSEVLEGGAHGAAGEVQPVAEEDFAVGPERTSVLRCGTAWSAVLRCWNRPSSSATVVSNREGSRPCLPSRVCQCQLGVLPLGTGNDLARVLGWGSACDDDTQLPQILEKLERASTKMLDR